MKLSRIVLLALLTLKEGNRNYSGLIDGKLVVLSPNLIDALKKGTINAITFKEEGVVTLGKGTADEKEVPSMRFSSADESQFALIDEAIKIKSHSLTADDLKLAASLQQGNL